MRVVLIFILSAFFTVKVIGQYNEFSIHVTSGLFSFGGSDAASSTFLFFNTPISPSTSYKVVNPYGTNSGFSYGFGFQAQRLTKSNYIIGLQTCYESLSSKVKIDSAMTFNSNGVFINYKVSDGKTILTHQFLNFQPYFGKRIKIFKEVKTDLTLGLDIGVCLNYKEHTTGTYSQGNKFDITNYELFKPTDAPKSIFDLRPRFEFKNYYKKIGLTVGYSYGLTNYTDYGFFHPNEVFSRMIRIGFAYKI